MNMNDNFSWNDTALDAEQLLDEVELLDAAFVQAYRNSLSFAGLLVQGGEFAPIAAGYLSFAAGLAGSDIDTPEELEETLWAGYHPIPLLFARLRWYGQLGKFHYTDADSAPESLVLKQELETARAFERLLPAHWIASEHSRDKSIFTQTLVAAEARLALDSGNDLTTEQVAALSGLESRTFQNALSKKGDAGLRADASGVVSHGEAVRWLSQRRGFIETVLYRRDQQDVAPTQDGDSSLREYVFVPVTDDGAAFLPELRRPGGYQVGKYGDEVYFQDYFDALKTLQAMDTPRFRRPNAEGNWGIKNGTGWQRVALDDLKAAVQRFAA